MDLAFNIRPKQIWCHHCEYLDQAENVSEAANGCGLQQFVVAIDHNVYEIIERLITSEGHGISAVVIYYLICYA